MSATGFAVLCGPDGIVLSNYGGDEPAVGTSLAVAVARESRQRLLQILADARLSEQHSIIETGDGATVEVHCAAEDGRLLVVAALNAGEVRRRCEELFDEPLAGPLARRIAATSVPDELTIDLWQQLARVNNDLATAQRQLARNNAELRWLNEQKNQLLGMAAHDLRNPLAAVIAYTEFLREDEAQFTADQRSMLRRISANVETMLEMVEDVVDFSAVESGTVRLDLVEVTLRELVSDVVENNLLVAEKKDIRIAWAVHPDVPQISADRRKLAQVLNNIVNNAIKFSHRGSAVDLDAGFDPEAGIRIAVVDRGLGMSPEQREQLFKPFGRVGVQATAGEKSTGLGLAIARRIVEAHQGRIEVESVQGEGTTFTVVLPVSAK